MPEWASSLIGAVIGGSLTGGFTLGGLWWRMKEERRHRQEDEERERARREDERQHQRRSLGAAVAASLDGLVTDAEPMRLTAHVGEHTQEQLDEMWDRWRSVREALLEYAVEHPNLRVGEVAGEVQSAIPNALTNAVWAVANVQSAQTPHPIDAARIAQANARSVADRFLALVRDEDEPPPTSYAELAAELGLDESQGW